MNQEYKPEFGVGATRGWCLKYIDDAGNSPLRSPTAKGAFYAEQKANRIRLGDSPDGVWAVGFLDFTSGPFTKEGHVFFMKHLGNGRYEIRDSEVGAGSRKPYGSIAELTAWFGAYSPRYLGWSTDCDGRTYIKEIDTVKTTLDQARIVAFMNGRNGFNGSKNALDGSYDDDLKKNHVGKELDQVLVGWYQSLEGANYRDHVLPSVFNERDQLKKENEALKAQLDQSPDEFVKLSEIYVRK